MCFPECIPLLWFSWRNPHSRTRKVSGCYRKTINVSGLFSNKGTWSEVFRSSSLAAICQFFFFFSRTFYPHGVTLVETSVLFEPRPLTRPAPSPFSRVNTVHVQEYWDVLAPCAYTASIPRRGFDETEINADSKFRFVFFFFWSRIVFLKSNQMRRKPWLPCYLRLDSVCLPDLCPPPPKLKPQSVEFKPHTLMPLV